MPIAVVGDNIVDVLSGAGADTLASVGGNCLNVAVNLHRLGARVQYIGSVGDDAAGVAVIAQLDAEGLAADRIVRISGAATGFATIYHVEGDRRFGAFDRGASEAPLAPEQWSALSGAQLIHTSYSSALEAQVEQLASIAPVSFDFDEHFDDAYVDSLIPFVSHAFFSAAARDDDEIRAYARRLLQIGVQTVTVTRAERSAMHFRVEGEWHQPSLPIEAVDTLGAGDAFIAGMIAGIVGGADPQSTLIRAAEIAARTCSEQGSVGLFIDPDLVGGYRTSHKGPRISHR
nr:PfkB family carbohydrate kinase [Brevibacterium sp. 68QC2CO]